MALGVAFVLLPGVPALCPTRLLFHFPCPSCGLTRAARCLLHADIVGATRTHPLWWVVFPYVGAIAAMEARAFVTTGVVGKSAERPAVQRAGLVVLVALILVWVARGVGMMGGPVAV